MQVFKLPIALRSPSRFRAEPRAQLRVFNLLERHGWDLLAIYHAHPNGPPAPSRTDVDEAA